MNTPDELDLRTIRRAWSKLTSSVPDEWTPANKARGQCAITACIIQDCLGGRLIRTVATQPDGSTESHYANLLDNGVILDATWVQFPDGTEVGPWEEREREYVLGFPETLTRFQLLMQRIDAVCTLDAVAEEGISPT